MTQAHISLDFHEDFMRKISSQKISFQVKYEEPDNKAGFYEQSYITSIWI